MKIEASNQIPQRILLSCVFNIHMMQNHKLSKSFKISFVVGLSFTSIGLILLLSGLTALGTAFFFFLPLAIGVSSGMLPDMKQAMLGTLVSLAIFSAFLLFTKIEGVICVIMALPILLGAIALGFFIGKIIKRNRDQNKSSLKMSFMPFLLFVVFNFFEIFSGTTREYHEVASSIDLNADKISVYNAIIAVDTVDVETNFLQKIGLPTPRKCVLTENKVGGLRLCAFEEGEIVETITDMKEGEYLKMDVTSCKLDHERSWLKFDKDIYTMKTLQNGKTRITRTTSYYSNLKPRKYWELMEAVTIHSEQDFVFRNLKKDVDL